MLSTDHKDLAKSGVFTTSRDRIMSDVFYARNLMREAFPKEKYGKAEAAFYAAYTFISKRVVKKLTVRRIRSIWEGTARRIDGEEIDALRAAVFEENKREATALRTRLAALDEKIAALDARMAR